MYFYSTCCDVQNRIMSMNSSNSLFVYTTSGTVVNDVLIVSILHTFLGKCANLLLSCACFWRHRGEQKNTILLLVRFRIVAIYSSLNVVFSTFHFVVALQGKHMGEKSGSGALLGCRSTSGRWSCSIFAGMF
uniref:Uncharacterized protein n=1 Tax=Trypanosoma congolense (strain IL3000) TaxID=1068625 RepID=G0UUC5_TRYCI|nr:hypothetical protein, unlikely [Trypanosoma congolense IL3000]